MGAWGDAWGACGGVNTFAVKEGVVVITTPIKFTTKPVYSKITITKVSKIIADVG